MTTLYYLPASLYSGGSRLLTADSPWGDLCSLPWNLDVCNHASMRARALPCSEQSFFQNSHLATLSFWP